MNLNTMMLPQVTGSNCMGTISPHYRQISDIRRTKLQNLDASRLVLQLDLCNPLKPYDNSTMKM